MSVRWCLRALGALDLDAAALLHRESFMALGEAPWSRQDIGSLLALPGVTGVLVHADGSAAGFALWQHAADEAELLTLAVSAKYRRRGLGRILVQAVAGAAHDAGALYLFLEVAVDNEPARALYEAAGFVEVGRRRAYYARMSGPAVDAIVMRLELS
jgi:ribosomal-protein-alanine N-acetyltransferase